jgi:hypothetical protein
MYANKRKMKRTRQQELRVIESMNRNGIDYILQQQANWVQQLIEMQKNQLALLRCLAKRGLITELMIATELREIEELEEMKKKALIINPNKATGKTP